MLYKYPQAAFPYRQLVEENHKRGKQQEEYELLDTGVFDQDRYFDVFVEYAKAGPNDILMRITVHNRGPEAAPLHYPAAIEVPQNLELGLHNRTYENIATKFFEHFLHIAKAMTHIGDDGVGLWNDEDGFFTMCSGFPAGN